ncbi:MAG: response regulator [Longimicrobiales bacterium]
MKPSEKRPTAPHDGNHAATILLAEDHLDSREALCALLEAFGFHVVPAINGAEAVSLARQNPPDLVLMDIMMPEVDGFEATRQLRDFPETRHIPIITLTAMEGARYQALEAGADDFLAKPINSGQLLDKVRDWLTD